MTPNALRYSSFSAIIIDIVNPYIAEGTAIRCDYTSCCVCPVSLETAFNSLDKNNFFAAISRVFTQARFSASYSSFSLKVVISIKVARTITSGEKHASRLLTSVSSELQRKSSKSSKKESINR